MCGIAGIVRPGASDESLEAGLDGMWGGIVSRGPDGRGQFIGSGVGLLNARLAVIDLPGGDQPLWNERRTVVCVFNGEIYNHKDLRSALVAAGHQFSTSCDTEVLVHLYEDHGTALVHRLRGMYTFAIYDLERQRLFVARDRLGIKPLYMARLAGSFAFASTIESLLALGVSRDPDLSALAEYLRFYRVSEPRTAYLNISALLPGHRLSLSLSHDTPHIDRFYELPTAASPANPVDAEDEAREVFASAVARHLISDVEIGAFLSGGIDSSLVVAEAQRISGRPLRTFSIGFPGSGGFDESDRAAQIASALGSRHEPLYVDQNPLDLIHEALATTSQPFAVASFLPSLVLSKSAARAVKVVLTGDGGDEVGLGYPWYRWMRYSSEGRRLTGIRERAASKLHRLEGRVSARGAPDALRRMAKFGRGAVLGGPRASDAWRYDLSSAEARSLLLPEHRSNFERHSPMETAWVGTGVQALRRADMEVSLRDEMLPKLDRSTMAYGLEARVPLLDDDFVEAMIAVPLANHLAHPRGKALLRRWVKQALPEVNFDGPKHGFDVPIEEWLINDLREEADRLLLRNRRPSVVDPSAATHAWRRMEGGAPGAAHTCYAMLVVELWCESGVNGPLLATA